MNILLMLIIIVVCLVVEGFFSGSEMGIVSADQMKLRHEAAKGSRGARLALKLLKKPEWLLSTTLVGTNIAVVTNTTVTTALMIYLFGEQGSWWAILLAAPLIWVFGEIVPKSVFQQRADTITPRVAFLLQFASYLFFPFLVVFTFFTRMVTKVVGDQRQSPFTLREEIVSARIELDVLEEELGLHLPEGTYATLAGFLLEKARDVPAAGTIIEAYNIIFTIRRATPQAIQEVRLRW